MITISISYFALLIAGIYFLLNYVCYLYIKDGDDLTKGNTWAMLLFGLPLLIIMLVYFVAIRPWYDYFQVGFFFSYLIGRYKRIDKSKLERMNENAEKYRNSNSRRDRIYRYCIRLLNKQAGYAPPQKEMWEP